MNKKSLAFSVLLLLAAGLASCQNQTATDADSESTATVVSLTQTGCQFLEVEAKNHEFEPTSAQDCETINADTLTERQEGFEPLTLEAGDYVFEVTNQNVPYDLGFYLRGAEGEKNLPKVSGGGLKEGVTKEYKITLKPGKYVFSCPLNPTPDYPVIVQ